MRRGLTQEEVAERVRQGKVNKIVTDDENTVADIVRRNTLTFFNFVFVAIAILLCLVRAWNQLTFLPIIIINTVVGIFQEIKAKQVLDRMNLLHAAHATVIRDGKETSVLSEDLVQDDLVLLKSGKQIMADARVVDGFIAVNESLLTGETDEIDKQVGDTLMSGSFVVSGQAYAVLEKVGADSYISQLSLEAKAMNVEEQSEILKALNKVLKYVSFVILPIAAILFTQNFFINHRGIETSVVSTVSAIIGMIPEGLYLLTTLALVMSSVKLARHQVLLHNMKSIESLAHVDTLCVDKTGTITEPTMSVERLFVSSQGRLTEQDLLQKLVNYTTSSPDDNETMQALRTFTAGQASTDTAQSVLPFSSSAKLGGMVFPDETLLLGAPEFVLRDHYATSLPDIQVHLQAGNRVLVLARYHSHELQLPLTAPATPLGYLVISNPIRANAVKTFAYFTAQDVELKVISGDNPETVAEVARRAGIPHAEKCIDAVTLQTEVDFDRAVADYTVFGRVTPEQKRSLVQALHRADRTVAMTGDGVNDILAMKEADCSVAMSSGSEAATQVAQVVLLDNDFDKMTDVLHEGRRVVNNVQRSSILFLAKNIFSMLLAIISIVFVVTYPIKASQLSLISAFTIGIPGFLLSLEVNTKRIKKNFIRQVIFKALPASLTSISTVLIVMLAGSIFHIRDAEVSTAAVILMAVVGFMIMIEISLPMNTFKRAVVAICMLGICLSALVLHKLFALSRLSLGLIALIAVLSIISFYIYKELDKWISRWV